MISYASLLKGFKGTLPKTKNPRLCYSARVFVFLKYVTFKTSLGYAGLVNIRPFLRAKRSGLAGSSTSKPAHSRSHGDEDVHVKLNY